MKKPKSKGKGKSKGRPNLHEQLSERRAKRPPKDPETLTAAAARGRVNTIPSNGDLPSSVEVAPETVPVGEAIRRAVEELGDVVISDELAPGQLRQLGDAYEEVAKRAAEYAAKSEAAKIAKKSYDSAVEFLLERVKAFTHPAPLPLFDTQQAEDDERDMLDAANENGDADETAHHADA